MITVKLKTPPYFTLAEMKHSTAAVVFTNFTSSKHPLARLR